jgi:hypothetical protein
VVETQAATSLQLRYSALRFVAIKPTSIDVERVRNLFGDNLSSKRECMHKGSLAQLLHARVNMQLVPCDQPTGMDLSQMPDMESMFVKVFDVVAESDEQEEAAEVAKASDVFHNEEDMEEVDVLAVDPLADEELCADAYEVFEVITSFSGTLNVAEQCKLALACFTCYNCDLTDTGAVNVVLHL